MQTAVGAPLLYHLMQNNFFFFLGRGFTIGQAAQRAPQKTTDPALAGSVRTRCPRTHNWCDRHTPHPSGRSSRRRTGRRDLHRRRTRRPSCLRRSLEHQTH